MKKKLWRIVQPNDYGSDEDYREMLEALHLDGTEDPYILDDLWVEAVHSHWPGLQVQDPLDWGFTAWAETPPPPDLPCWIWVAEADEQDLALAGVEEEEEEVEA